MSSAQPVHQGKKKKGEFFCLKRKKVKVKLLSHVLLFATP